MVNAQASHHTLLQQAEDQGVHRREDLGLLNTDRHEVVNLKEAAIVHLVGGHTPVAEPVGLLRQEGL